MAGDALYRVCVSHTHRSESTVDHGLGCLCQPVCVCDRSESWLIWLGMLYDNQSLCVTGQRHTVDLAGDALCQPCCVCVTGQRAGQVRDQAVCELVLAGDALCNQLCVCVTGQRAG